MNLFGLMQVSGSAMKAERVRAEVVASNMANAETTRSTSGTPYRRQHVVFEAQGTQDTFASQLLDSSGTTMQASPQGGMQKMAGNVFGSFDLGAAGGRDAATGDGSEVPGGVEVAAVTEDSADPLRRYDPGHPDADADGYVSYPDINPLTEMVDLMGATRAYELNSSAVQAAKNMISSSIDIVKS